MGVLFSTKTLFSAKTVRYTLFLLIALFFFYEAFRALSRAPLLTPWDFWAFWGGARALNLGLDPYNPANLHSMSIPAPFVSPLFLGELLQPLAHFPLMTAKMVWAIFSFIEAAATVVILLYLSKTKLALPSLLIGAALFAAFEPFSGTILLGQTDTLVVFALALSWLLLEQRRMFLAGLVFCLGATNPHLITGVGFYYLYRSFGRREYALLFGMLAGAGVILATFLIHPSYGVEWFTRVLLAKENTEMTNILQLTLIHLFAYFLGLIPHANAALLATILSLSLGFIACVCAIVIWSKSGGKSLALDMAIATVLTLIACPFAFHQDFLLCVLVAPSLVLLLRSGVSVHKVAFLFLCASTFFFSSLTGFINGGVYEHRLPFHYYAPFLSMTLAALLCLTTRQALVRALPWLAVFALFSLTGSFLPELLGAGIIQYEKVIILLGLLLFFGGMWRWHPALTSSSTNTLDEAGAAPAASPAGDWLARTS